MCDVDLLLTLMEEDTELKQWLLQHSPVVCERMGLLVGRRASGGQCECDSGGCSIGPLMDG